jgi:hypothetical protein
LGSLQLLHGSQNTAELLELVEKNCKEEFRGKLILLVKNVTSLIKIKLGTALENEPCKFFYFLAILKWFVYLHFFFFILIVCLSPERLLDISIDSKKTRANAVEKIQHLVNRIFDGTSSQQVDTLASTRGCHPICNLLKLMFSAIVSNLEPGTTSVAVSCLKSCMVSSYLYIAFKARECKSLAFTLFLHACSNVWIFRCARGVFPKFCKWSQLHGCVCSLWLQDEMGSDLASGI